MRRLLALAFAFLLSYGPAAVAADLYAQVSGVAEIFDSSGPNTDIISSGTVLPNGGRAFDFGNFSHGGALCTANTGQVDYLCANAMARVEIDKIPVQTTTYIGVATAVRLKAKASIDYTNADGYGQVWGRATLDIPIACHGGVVPPIGGLSVQYTISGEHSVSISDAAVTVNAPPAFQSCDQNGHCVVKVPTFHCPDEGFTTTLTIDLYPLIQFNLNHSDHTGWSLHAVSDYSHTLTLDGIDVVDTQDQPLPNVRVVVPGDGGTINNEFLTTAEAQEVASQSSTTTTTTDVGTTSTTVPPCATGDLAAASCRCDQRPVAGCEGVTLKGAVDKRVNGLCAKLAKATAATGKKQTRLARQAGKLAKQTLAALGGRKAAKSVPPACLDGLRTFVQEVQGDLAGASH